MSKAEQLTTDIDQGNYSLRDLKEAAALLRTQDALLRQALDAMEWEQKWNELQKTRNNVSTIEAIEAIKEHLK